MDTVHGGVSAWNLEGFGTVVARFEVPCYSRRHSGLSCASSRHLAHSKSRAEEILIVPESEVYCFKAADKCVLLCTYNESHVFDMTLKELEARLDPGVFCRIHKGHIVSLDKVRKIHRWFHGDLVVQLEDVEKSKLKVGRSYRKDLRDRLSL